VQVKVTVPRFFIVYNLTAGRVKQTNFKMRKSLFTAVAVGLGLTAKMMAQNNCNLINSITLNVPSNNYPQLVGGVPYLSDSDTTFFCPLNLNQWNYIAITKDNNNVGKVYKNGQLIYQGTYVNTFYSWSRLDLGAVYYTGYGGWFNGFIDEVRLSNTVRTSQEIENHFLSNLEFNSDANTIGLWHFNENAGTVASATIGISGSLSNSVWDANGKYSNCLYYNGTNARTTMNQSIPTSNMSFEFWIKPILNNGSWPVCWYGANTAGFTTGMDTIVTQYNWSTGATGNSVTVDPTQLPYVWVTDGNCTDTVWFDSQSATIYDTITTNVTVYDTLLTTITDTLIINTTLSLPAPNNENTILIYPNPASDHITIDNGNFSAMAGYSIKIENNAGQQVFQSAINQQQFYVDLSTWTGNGLYFVHLIDPQNNTVTVRKIVLQ
jgi:hypothetical protein